ncbi:MAG: ABC transporter permease [Planctomycetota bacterium]|nr:MAG: ABC transporter permease [Planctomycetota bacterium]REJ96964.1 MAG: ABC transporter permease [Planctomycetota bacterium]REK26379.1 MAG: ABC transporter permease [Planctomycetota bacterium]REK37928.1 MAG: ABC transporter permease [Planctomycetota bacterium]
MSKELTTIAIADLGFAFLPVLVVCVILYRWSHNVRGAIVAVSRMLAQLLAVGYVLAFIFRTDRALVVLGTLAVMFAAASWISLGPVREERGRLLAKALISIALGGVTTLVLITQGVLRLDPWFEPRYMIPLAGMIFANAMNAISLAAERFTSELRNGRDYLEARRIAYSASLIPITNSLLAVGIVAIPGMMTGQILAGASPLVAVRYQIMVMAMVFGSAGISSACFLRFIRPPDKADVIGKAAETAPTGDAA